ncbi:hypothetical protein [Blautia hydrogenotrophica]|nr:hypothetical protein [Blautia hydrogenotrophica]MEE0463294.1 hypothetical protein [Blautia hydrogenotrophica]
MSKKWIFFFLILACLSLVAGCGEQEETQPKGELVMVETLFTV